MGSPSWKWFRARKNKLADSEMGEGDFGWAWTMMHWSILANNPCLIEGVLIATSGLIGIINVATELEGIIKDEELEGGIGIG